MKTPSPSRRFPRRGAPSKNLIFGSLVMTVLASSSIVPFASAQTFPDTVQPNEVIPPSFLKATLPLGAKAYITGEFGIEGTFSFIQQAQGIIVAVDITSGLSKMKNENYSYHIHTNPIPSDGNCAGALAHLDPLNVGEVTMCDKDKPYLCQTGDLSGKHGKIPSTSDKFQTSYTDFDFNYFPQFTSILGRSIVLHSHDKTRLACGNITSVLDSTSNPSTKSATGSVSTFQHVYPPTTPSPPLDAIPPKFRGYKTFTAKAKIFGNGVEGLVTFVQEKAGGVKSYHLELERPSWASWPPVQSEDIAKGLTNKTDLYNWHVHDFPISNNGDCLSAKGHLDPLQVGDSFKCDPLHPEFCQIGDLGGKHGKLKPDQYGGSKAEITDSFLTFQNQPFSLLGRSIVIHRPDASRLACGTITSVLDGTADENGVPTGKVSNYQTVYPSGGVKTPINLTPPTSVPGATEHKVIVGGDAGLVFTPNDITAKVGDKVTFSFRAKNHSVVQSSFNKPCELFEDNVTGRIGFDTDFIPVAGNATVFPTYTITVTADKPIWFYCKQANHCSTGMVGAINAPKSGNTLGAFKALAAKAKTSLKEKGSPFGGVFAMGQDVNPTGDKGGSGSGSGSGPGSGSGKSTAPWEHGASSTAAAPWQHASSSQAAAPWEHASSSQAAAPWIHGASSTSSGWSHSSPSGVSANKNLAGAVDNLISSDDPTSSSSSSDNSSSSSSSSTLKLSDMLPYIIALVALNVVILLSVLGGLIFSCVRRRRDRAALRRRGVPSGSRGAPVPSSRGYVRAGEASAPRGLGMEEGTGDGLLGHGNAASMKSSYVDPYDEDAEDEERKDKRMTRG